MAVTCVHGASARIRATLAPLLPPASRCALVGFPNHGNVGDSAIWLGTRGVLDRLGARVVYACDPRNYDRDALAAALGGDGTILLCGGGNLGDLYPRAQTLRESVLTDFPDTRVIQLPQSIHFQASETLDRFMRICARQRDFTLLLREQRSLAFAREHFDATSRACPDLAFALGEQRRPVAPDLDVLWLARADRESREVPVAHTGANVLRVDWLARGREDVPAPLARLNRRVKRGRERPRPGRLTREVYDPLARARLARGLRLLSRGRVVVTDRLHGHLLALLLGIPHVALDNSTGKVRAVWESWTGSAPGVTWADDPRQALEFALAMVSREM